MEVLNAKDFKLEMSAKIYKKDPKINNTLLHINVHSSDFSGAMDMEVGINDLKTFINDIHMMNTKLKGLAKIKEPYGESFIIMEVDKTGHIIVSGYMNTLNHRLYFTNEFEPLYLDQFDKLLNNTSDWQEVI